MNKRSGAREKIKQRWAGKWMSGTSNEVSREAYGTVLDRMISLYLAILHIVCPTTRYAVSHLHPP